MQSICERPRYVEEKTLYPGSITRFILLFILLFFLLPAHSYAGSTKPGKIKIVYCIDSYPFQYRNEKGEPEGIIIDYWKLWSVKTGISVDFMPAVWDETLNIMKKGEADAHAGLFQNAERSAYLDYGAPLTPSEIHIFYDRRIPNPEKNGDFNAYRIGVINGDFVESWMKSNQPEASLKPYDNYDELIKAFERGNIKVFAADTQTALYYLGKSGIRQNVNFRSNSPLYESDWRIAVKKGDTSLLQLINSGMAAITDKEAGKIAREWATGSKVEDSGALIIAIERNYPPLTLMDPNGEPTGLLIDMWKLWSNATGVKIAFRPSAWADTISAIKNSEADIHSGLFKNEEREAWMDFSNPIYKADTALFFHNSEPPLVMDELSGLKVGVIAGSYQEEYIRKTNDKIVIVPYLDGESMILALLKKDIRALVHETNAVEAELNRMGLPGGVKQGGGVLFENTIHAAVKQGNQILLDLINSGFEKIPLSSLISLESKWITGTENRFYKKGRTSVKLTVEEREWIAEKKIIRVHNEMDWPPFNFNENGRPMGFSIDYITLLAERVGLNVEFVNGPSWNEFIEMLKKGNLDVMMNIARTPEREKYFYFTPEYTNMAQMLFTRTEFPEVNDINDLFHKRFAVPKGFYLEEILKKYPEIEIISVHDTSEAIQAVSAGKADALFDLVPVVKYMMDQLQVKNLKIGGRIGINESAPIPLHMAVSINNQLLGAIIEKGMNMISDEEADAMYARWTGKATVTAPKAFTLTREEQEWISVHDNIRIGADNAWPPIEWIDSRKGYLGIGSEVMRKLENDLRVRLMPPEEDISWDRVLKKIQKREVDILPCVMRVKERENYLLFTRPYMKFPYVIAVNNNTTDIKALSDLKNKTLGIVKAYAIEDLLKINHPEIILKKYDTISAALSDLSSGKIKAVIENRIVVNHAISNMGLSNIEIVGKTPYFYEMSIGVRKDWPQLAALLEKWISNLSPDETRAIELTYEHYIIQRPEDDSENLYHMLGKLFGILTLIAAVILIIGYFLGKTIFKREKSLYHAARIKGIGLLVISLFLFIVIFSAWFAVKQLKKEVIDELAASISTVLKTTHEALSIWVESNIAIIEGIADTDIVRNAVIDLMSLPLDREKLKNSNAQKTLRDYFTSLRTYSDDTLFFVIGTDHVNHAATEDAYLGLTNMIANDRPTLLYRVFSGETILIPPVPSEDKSKDGSKPFMFFATPIIDNKGDISAVLAVKVDMSRDFTRIMQLGRLGKTGETYAFDDKARLVSMSRFEDSLKNIGIVGKNEEAVLNLLIRDPGVNLTKGGALPKDFSQLPMTWMAQKAVSGVDGIDLDGYRDYRGVYVLGTWLWDSRLNIGLAMEIDREEAMSAYHFIRNTVIILLSVTVMLSALLTGLAVWIGQRANKSLLQAKNELEERVNKRTAELQEREAYLWDLYENAPVAYASISLEKREIVKHNKSFSKLTAYDRIEFSGLSLGALCVDEKTSAINNLISRSLEGETVENLEARLKSKNGSIISVAVSSSPVKNDKEAYVETRATFIDITERKAAEKRVHALLESAPDPMIVINEEGDILIVNTQAESLFGFDEKELVGNKVEILLPEHIRKKHVGNRRRYMETPEIRPIGRNLELYGCKKDKTVFPAEVSLSPIDTDQGLWVAAVVRDITQRKQEDLVKAGAHRNLSTINRINRAVMQSKTEAQLLSEICKTIVETNDKLFAWIGFAESNSAKSIRITDWYGFEKGYLSTLFLTWSEKEKNLYPAGEVIRTGKYCLVFDVNDATSYETYRKNAVERGYYSVLSLPLMKQGDAFGAITVYSDKAGGFDENNIDSMIQIADIVSHGILAQRSEEARKKAEKAMMEAERQTRLILDSAEEGIFGVDAEGRIDFVNPAACKMLGMQDKELLGGMAHPLIQHSYSDGSHYPAEQSLMCESFTEGVSRNVDDEVFWRKDGSSFPVEYTSTPVRKNGDIIGAVVTFRDITERKKSEERVKTILNSINTGIIIINPEQRIITDVNPVAADMIGLPKEEIIGKKCHRFICTMANKDCPIIDHGMKLENVERILVTADGKEIPILKTVVSIVLGEEKLLLESFVDLTERKKAEEELKRHMEDLESFNRLTINREERMIELKEEINKLLKEIGREEKYEIVE